MNTLKKPTIDEIIKMLDFSTEDGEFFIDKINLLNNNFGDKFLELKTEYLKKESRFNELSNNLSNVSGINKYTIDFCVLLELCPDLYLEYVKNGYDQSFSRH